MTAPTTRRWRSVVGAAVDVSVDGNHCHLYAICEQEAPEVFRLHEGRQLVYIRHVEREQVAAVRQAARLCPMQAIELREL